MTVDRVIARLGGKIWQDYFTFAFVRNPYDRFVSLYFYAVGVSESDDLESCTRGMIKYIRDFGTKYVMLKPQHLFTHHKGEQAVDYIGRFENLPDDWDLLLCKLNLPYTPLPMQNKGRNHRPTAEYMDFSPKLVGLLNEMYHKDFELLGYDKL